MHNNLGAGVEGVSRADERDCLLAPALWAARYSCATAPKLRGRAQARCARSDSRRARQDGLSLPLALRPVGYVALCAPPARMWLRVRCADSRPAGTLAEVFDTRYFEPLMRHSMCSDDRWNPIAAEPVAHGAVLYSEQVDPRSPPGRRVPAGVCRLMPPLAGWSPAVVEVTTLTRSAHQLGAAWTDSSPEAEDALGLDIWCDGAARLDNFTSEEEAVQEPYVVPAERSWPDCSWPVLENGPSATRVSCFLPESVVLPGALAYRPIMVNLPAHATAVMKSGPLSTKRSFAVSCSDFLDQRGRPKSARISTQRMEVKVAAAAADAAQAALKEPPSSGGAASSRDPAPAGDGKPIVLPCCKFVGKQTQKGCKGKLHITPHKRGHLGVACSAGRHQWVWCALCCHCNGGPTGRRQRGCTNPSHWFERDAFDTGARNHMSVHRSDAKRVPS